MHFFGLSLPYTKPRVSIAQPKMARDPMLTITTCNIVLLCPAMASPAFALPLSYKRMGNMGTGAGVTSISITTTGSACVLDIEPGVDRTDGRSEGACVAGGCALSATVPTNAAVPSTALAAISALCCHGICRIAGGPGAAVEDTRAGEGDGDGDGIDGDGDGTAALDEAAAKAKKERLVRM